MRPTMRIGSYLSVFYSLFFAFSPLLYAKLSALRNQRGQFVNASGQAVVLHGVNLMNRKPPYTLQSIGFEARHMQFLSSFGFNLVRLGVVWAAIEPTPGQYDVGYLSQIKTTMELLAKEKIYSIVDFHQGSFSTRHGGSGAPPWAALSKGPFKNVGFPLNYFSDYVYMTTPQGIAQKVSPQVAEDFTHFWQDDAGPDGEGIQTRYHEMLGFVASYLQATDGLLGYDLMNEPFPGIDWRKCLKDQNVDNFDFSSGCREFDTKSLTPFYQRAVDVIQHMDAQAIVFYEPSIFFYSNMPTFVGKIQTDAGNLGFSFHNYNLHAPQIPLQHMRDHQTVNGIVPFMSEFGAGTASKEKLYQILQLVQNAGISWTYWTLFNNPEYKFADGFVSELPKDPAKQGLIYDMRGSLTRESGNVDYDTLTLLAKFKG